MTYNSKYSFSFAALAFATTATALVINPTNDATVLANAVLGSGITLVSATYSGTVDSSGTFTDGPLGIRDSIVMTTGKAIDTIPGDSAVEGSKANGTPGSTLCQSLNGGVLTLDAAILTMDVVLDPAYSGFFTEFVFASEEYPDWVGSDFNDVFGIWIDGKQIAADSTGAPITINGGFFSSGNVLTPPASGSNFDGSTPLLRAGGSVIEPGAHTIQIAICDTADSLLDSSVFLTLGACTDPDNCKTGAVIAPPSSTTTIVPATNTSIIAPVTTIPANTSTVVVLPTTTSSVTNGTLPEVTSTSTTVVLPIGTNPTAPIVTGPVSSLTSSVIAPYGNGTVSDTVAPTNIGTTTVITTTPAPGVPVEEEEEAPCVTYTSYITKTLTKCDQNACHATTTVKPTVVTSTLQLTVYTPCSTVTVSKCGVNSECVTYTNTVTYPAVTGYPPVPTFDAPEPEHPVSSVTPESPAHASPCTPGVNCPHVPVVSTTPGAPAHPTGVAVPSAPSAPSACTPGTAECPHDHPVPSSGVPAVPTAPVAPAPSTGAAVPSAPAAGTLVDSPHPDSSAVAAAPSAPPACAPGTECPYDHPVSSSGVPVVPTVPGAPVVSATPGAPAYSTGADVPSVPSVPSAPSACTPGVDCPHPASSTDVSVVSACTPGVDCPDAAPVPSSDVIIPTFYSTTSSTTSTTSSTTSTTSSTTSTTSTSSTHSSTKTSSVTTKTTSAQVKPTSTSAAVFEGAATKVEGMFGVMAGLVIAGVVAML